MELAQGKALTPIAFVQAITRVYEQRGLSPLQALRTAQIPPALLKRASAQVTAAQFEALSAAAMKELDDEALGWFSRRLPWGSYGMLCRASLGAPDLDIALRRWCRHHALLTDDVVLRLQRDGTRAVLAIEERRDLGALREFCLLTLLRYVHGYASWLIDSRLSLHEVALPLPAPAHADVYPLLFPGPVRWQAPQAAFTFDAGYLAMPPRRDEAALQRMLQNALLLTVRQYRRDRLFAQQVRQALMASPRLEASAEAMAARLNVSLRTLHRQLAEEHTSYQRLKDEVRLSRAQDLLARQRRPVKQVAFACGFRSEQSFARAFRQWTGTTPSEVAGPRP